MYTLSDCEIGKRRHTKFQECRQFLLFYSLIEMLRTLSAILISRNRNHHDDAQDYRYFCIFILRSCSISEIIDFGYPMGSIWGEFLKHYLKIRVDCNYIVFVTTANYTDVGVTKLTLVSSIIIGKRMQCGMWVIPTVSLNCILKDEAILSKIKNNYSFFRFQGLFQVFQVVWLVFSNEVMRC